MNGDCDFNLPVSEELPPPPPMEPAAFQEYWLRRLADFYASPHYDAWFARTSAEMRSAQAFVWID